MLQKSLKKLPRKYVYEDPFLNVSWLLKIAVFESAKSGFFLTGKVPQVPGTSQMIARTLKNWRPSKQRLRFKSAYILCNLSFDQFNLR